MAVIEKRPVLFFNMETSSSNLTYKLLSLMADIGIDKLKKSHFFDEAWVRLNTASALLSEANILIDDTADLTPDQIAYRSKKFIKQHGNRGLIIIDYIQRISTGNRIFNNRYEQISEITRSLKTLARELNVPILICSQLNRKLEDRVSKRPLKYDLRDSGCLEEEADLIMFLYRDEIYSFDSEERGLAELIIAKQRNGGAEGTIKLHFSPNIGRFS